MTAARQSNPTALRNASSALGYRSAGDDMKGLWPTARRLVDDAIAFVLH